VNLEGHGDTEKVYRVDLRPVAPPEQMDSTGVRVLVGYQLLVFVAPAQTGVSLEGQRDGKSLTLTNKGNVNVLLHEGEQCPPSPSTQPCEPVQGRRLYPGNRFSSPLPI
jgi:P pilus assembly chaperone PapD